jgi:hypothetical protein
VRSPVIEVAFRDLVKCPEDFPSQEEGLNTIGVDFECFFDFVYGVDEVVSEPESMRFRKMFQEWFFCWW